MKATAELLNPPRILIRARISDFAELTKARLTLLVLLTTFVGFYLGSPGRPDWLGLTHTLIGTALLAAGAAALNQLWERHRDGRMIRTRHRPLPAGRLEPGTALRFGAACSVAGIAWLTAFVSPLTAGVGGATLVAYLFIYTPLKTKTLWNTLVGAFPGALPPVIGWVAARGTMDQGSWLLFALQFLWQIPHFLAIAWLYREDYARGGFAMLPVLDPSGCRTGRHSVIAATALLAVALLTIVSGMAGWLVGTAVFLATGGYLLCAIRFSQSLSEADARRLFFGSIAYLPIVLGGLVLNRLL